jgi:tetratricopeptide (TPR) repeat protein
MAAPTRDPLDTLIDAFESEWRVCRRPDIAAFLARAGEAERPALLRELVRLELEYRLRGGEPARVEEYTSRFPETAAEAVELIALEYRVRLDCGEHVRAAEYLERFPALRDTLPAVLGQLGGWPAEVPGFEIQGEIGRGGMGIVYKAVDLELGRPIALKVVRCEAARRPEVETRFLDEARITGRLQHPGVPPVYRVGKLPGGGSFLAMKLIEGTTLAARLAGRAAPGEGLADLLRVFDQIAQTVAYAHSRGVIHRDLKPANVMVGAFGEVQVMDWGLAKVLTGSSVATSGSLVVTGRDTQSGDVLGTPAYMPPEQAHGERVDERADVFALGAILCEILTGAPPHPGDPASALESARRGELAGVRQRLEACGADPAVVALATACLAAEPEARPADAAAVARVVAAHREDAEERARHLDRERAAALARMAEERRRRRALLAAAALLIAVLAAGIVGTSVGLSRASKARDRAEGESHRAGRANELALSALDAATDTMAGDALASQSKVSDSQKRFLESALPFYRQLTEEGGTDLRSRLRVARAANRVGHITHRLGLFEESLKASQTARKFWESLVTDFPDDIDHLFHLADALSVEGLAYDALGKLPEMDRSFRRALAVRQRIATLKPDVPAYDNRLAWAYYYLSALAWRRGRPAEGLRLAWEALRLRRRLASAFQGHADYRCELGMSERGLALLLLQQGNRAGAENALVRAVAELERVVKEAPSEARYRAELANALDSLATQKKARGLRGEARSLYQREILLLTELDRQFPSEPAYLCDLGLSHYNFGTLLTDQLPQAETEFRKSVEYLERLTKLYRQVPAYRQDLARSYYSLGLIFRLMGRKDQAEKQFLHALKIQKELFDQYPGVVRHKQELASTRLAIAAVYGEQGQFARAEEQFREAKKLLATLPGVFAQHNLAMTAVNLGHLLAQTGRRAAARTEFLEGKSLYEALLQRFHQAVEYRLVLAGAYNGLGKVDGESSPADGLAWFSRAVGLLDDPKNKVPAVPQRQATLRFSHVGRADCRLRLGQVDQAVAELDAVVAGSADRAEHHFAFACLYARASGQTPDGPLRTARADRAIELLRKAVAAGLRDQKKFQSKDLAPLRHRDDFKKLSGAARE